jgi:hypothetical protein
MPVVIAWIGEMLLSVVGQMVLSAMVAVGVGLVASTAASGVIDSSSLQSYMGAAGPLLAWVGVLRIDQSITVILSAWAGRVIVDAARVRLTSLSKSGSGTTGGAE